MHVRNRAPEVEKILSHMLDFDEDYRKTSAPSHGSAAHVETQQKVGVDTRYVDEKIVLCYNISCAFKHLIVLSASVWQYDSCTTV